MSERRGPNWRPLQRIVAVTGMMTSLLKRPGLLQKTQRPCSEDPGAPCRAGGKRYRWQAYYV